MRDLKFRAWDKKEKKFIAGFNMVNFHSYFNKGLEPSIYRYNTNWKLSEIELMQYTGLKDKNGKEIFEGDILERQGCGTLYEVYFESPCWKLKTKKDIYYKYRDFHGHAWKLIGNIYENPVSKIMTNENK